MTDFEKKIASQYKIKSRAVAQEYVGVNIAQTESDIRLSQLTHIDRAVQKYGLSSAGRVPMPHYYNGADGTESPELEDKRLYQSLVGTLNVQM